MERDLTKTAAYDYNLPKELIAQDPAEPRDSSRLMVVHKNDGSTEDRIFRDITEYLNSGDLLVLNDTRVLPARVEGVKKSGEHGAHEGDVLFERELAAVDHDRAIAGIDGGLAPLEAGAVVNVDGHRDRDVVVMQDSPSFFRWIQSSIMSMAPSMDCPPSMTKVWPVMKADFSSSARKSIIGVMSEVLPSRPSGIFRRNALVSSSE